MRGVNARDYVDLKKAGFYVEESGCPRNCEITGKARRAEPTLSTRTVWNVLDLSGCQIAVILWERSASRRRMVSSVKGSWAGRERDGGSDVEEGTGSGDGGTSRPATNITGASCTTSSGGYEFMLLSEARNGEVSRYRVPSNTSIEQFRILTQSLLWASGKLNPVPCTIRRLDPLPTSHTYFTFGGIPCCSIVSYVGTDITRDNM